MNLYLVRHAPAEARDLERWPDDSARPLTLDGVERFRRAARGLRRVAPRVDAVLASPYVRAWQTAEILREEAGWPAPERCEALGVDHWPEDALEALRARAEEPAVALVGHEPTLSMLASLLLAGDTGRMHVEFRKGTVALLSVGLVAAHGDLVWVASPKLLRALAA